MTFKQKLTKIGNSVGLILPKDLREALGIDAGAEVYLELDEGTDTIVLTTKRRRPEVSDSEYNKLMESVSKQYSEALEELASK